VALIRQTPNLDWLLLTNRAEWISACLPPDWGAGWPNIWLGVTIEDNDYVDRADFLRRVPAVARFISAEPLLGPLPSLDLAGIAMLIVGGESGSGYRPMNLDWARDLRRRCEEVKTAYWFKQEAALRPQMRTTLDGKTYHELPIKTSVVWPMIY
jgi:protein gp37